MKTTHILVFVCGLQALLATACKDSSGCLEGEVESEGRCVLQQDAGIDVTGRGSPAGATSLDAGAIDRGPADASIDGANGWDGSVAEFSTQHRTISAGRQHTCRIDDGRVACWGKNDKGQLGDGSRVDRTTPVRVAGLQDVIDVSAGPDHTCALQSSGAVSCWGQNDNGELGDGTTETRTSPTRVAGFAGARQLAAGVLRTCAVLSGGEVACSGLGTTEPRRIAGLRNAVAVSAGMESCAITEARQVTCWDQLELAKAIHNPGRPVLVPDVENVQRIAVGSQYSCAVLMSGQLKCWQIPNAIGTPDPTWLANAEATRDVVDVDLLHLKACALRNDGAVRCWGDGASDTLPLGAAEIAVGASHACAVLRAGGVECWGAFAAGELGNGVAEGDRLSPTLAGPVAVVGLQ